VSPNTLDNPLLDCLIIGGGLSGLSLAYYLNQQAQSIHLIESGSRLGGVIESVEEQGFLTESGPNTFPSSAEALVTLCHDLSLNPQPTSKAAKSRYLFLEGQMVPVKADPISFATSGILSASAMLKLMTEPLLKSVPSEEMDNLTVAEYFRKKLSQEWVDKLITPALSGIYAGDPEKMGFAATMPLLQDWETEMKSLLLGAVKKAFTPKVGSSAKRPYQLFSLPGGLQTLIKSLEQALPTTSVSLQTQVDSLLFEDHVWTVKLKDSSQCLKARNVALACPAYVSAHLLRPLSADASQLLNQIPYAPLTVLHLGFEKEQFQLPVNGFGCLVPRKYTGANPVSLLGCIFTSSLFPDRAPEHQNLFSCFIGGDLQPDDTNLPDEILINRTEQDISRLFYQPKALSSYQRLIRYPQAIPQYRPGHLGRLKQIDAALESIPGLHVLGNAYRGVSLNDCVKHARALAQEIANHTSSCTH
jgi:protoporphyrinogen/coproporphyrinogen III oxidase